MRRGLRGGKTCQIDGCQYPPISLELVQDDPRLIRLDGVNVGIGEVPVLSVRSILRMLTIVPRTYFAKLTMPCASPICLSRSSYSSSAFVALSLGFA